MHGLLIRSWHRLDQNIMTVSKKPNNWHIVSCACTFSLYYAETSPSYYHSRVTTTFANFNGVVTSLYISKGSFLQVEPCWNTSRPCKTIARCPNLVCFESCWAHWSSLIFWNLLALVQTKPWYFEITDAVVVIKSNFDLPREPAGVWAKAAVVCKCMVTTFGALILLISVFLVN